MSGGLGFVGLKEDTLKQQASCLSLFRSVRLRPAHLTIRFSSPSLLPAAGNIFHLYTLGTIMDIHHSSQAHFLHCNVHQFMLKKLFIVQFMLLVIVLPLQEPPKVTEC
jgi:hypothetical protein